MRRALRIGGGALAIAVVVLLALEGAARLLRLAPAVDVQNADFTAGDEIPFRRRPLSRIAGRSATDEFDFDYQHNSQGFRDVEHTFAKPPGVFRIVLLGDSFTFGVGAAFEETYPRRLERLLNQRPAALRPVEIVNLALPRYFPAIERIVLERIGLRYQPDLVVVGFVPNDVIDTYLGVEAVVVDDSGFLISRRGERLGRLAPWLYLRSHVMRIVLRRLAELLPPDRSPHPDEIYREDAFHEPDWRTVETELDRMRSLARDHGAAFVIVGIPQRGLARPERNYPDRRLERWSAEHGALFVPTLPALRRAGDEETLYWRKDGHCTGAGHEVIARTLFTALTRASSVP